MIYSIFYGYPFTGFFVIPGKSINVKSGTVGENTLHVIGSFDIPFSEPATLSVSSYITHVISYGSENSVFPFSLGKTKYGFSTLDLIILNSNGLLVTIPVPRGKKFNPAIVSNRDDLPADYSPNTAILGKDI